MGVVPGRFGADPGRSARGRAGASCSVPCEGGAVRRSPASMSNCTCRPSLPCSSGAWRSLAACRLSSGGVRARATKPAPVLRVHPGPWPEWRLTPPARQAPRLSRSWGKRISALAPCGRWWGRSGGFARAAQGASRLLYACAAAAQREARDRKAGPLRQWFSVIEVRVSLCS